MIEELLTLQTIAAQSGIPIGTLYTVCAPKGNLPVVRVVTPRSNTRPRIRVRRCDWDAWVEARRIAQTPAPSRSVERAAHRAALQNLEGWDRYSYPAAAVR